jgi:hypothetical protein
LRPFFLGAELFYLAALLGADPVIDVPKENPVYVPVVAKIKEATKDTKAVWKIVPTPAWKEESGQQVRFTGPPGTYYLSAVHVDFKAQTFGQLEGFTTIKGEGPAPVPPGPTPPGPNPPTPPDPSPIPEPGNRMLLVYETADLAKYTTGQIGFMGSTEVRQYLDAKCTKGTNSNGWYMLDKDAVMNAMPPLWQKAFARPRSKLPWLIVSNGATGWEGPMPERYEDAFAKVKEFIK